jgi:ADP-ribosylglycohydrolase
LDIEQRNRARNCILGALVADAASMGLHWVYSQRRIAELVPTNPEFRQPDEADYAGGVGYFAHGTRTAGDLSHYGEQLRVMLLALAASGGRYEKPVYQELFRRHFGYGGEFVGYIDRPTRQTLDRIYHDENERLAAADQVAFDGNSRERQGMLTKVLAAAKRFEGQRLREQVASYAAAAEHPGAALSYGLALVDALTAPDDFPGAFDEQLPAVSKLPPLVACHADDAEFADLCRSAIRVTNNAPRAMDFGMVCAELLRAAVRGASMDDVLAAGLVAAGTDSRALLERALAMNVSVPEATREFGLHCDLGAGVPSLMHNLKTAPDYAEAIRRNIAAGGDNCGRSLVLGGVCGACFGLGGELGTPDAWLARLTGADELTAMVDRVLDAAAV